MRGGREHAWKRAALLLGRRGRGGGGLCLGGAGEADHRLV